MELRDQPNALSDGGQALDERGALESLDDGVEAEPGLGEQRLALVREHVEQRLDQLVDVVRVVRLGLGAERGEHVEGGEARVRLVLDVARNTEQLVHDRADAVGLFDREQQMLALGHPFAARVRLS